MDSGDRVLVTGASGFVGPYLCQALRQAGYDVVSLARDGTVDWRVDVRSVAEVQAAFRAVRPRAVFHLAALAFVPEAEGAPDVADEVNRGGTASVLDAAYEVGARTLFVSSGVVYGRLATTDLPASEQLDIRPEGAYARSKAAAERECWKRSARQEIVVVRPFNHTGPGQSPTYVCSDFARQIALCESGMQAPVLEVGDLSSERDFSDVRDVVAAYVRAWEDGTPGNVYNVCSGRAVSIGSLLDRLVSFACVDIEVRVAPERLRSGEVSRMVGSFAKLEKATGWRPSIPLEQTLEDLLGDWRQRIRAETSG